MGKKEQCRKNRVDGVYQAKSRAQASLVFIHLQLPSLGGRGGRWSHLKLLFFSKAFRGEAVSRGLSRCLGGH